MCGRYVIEEDASVDLSEIYAQIGERHPEAVLKRGEIFPTDTVPLLGTGGGRLTAFPGSWGLPSSHEGRVLINARAETVECKPMFAEHFLNRRCVVPTSGYFEWSAQKYKYRLNLPKHRTLYLAGCYGMVGGTPHFLILTTLPSASVARIHDRMPLILPSGALLPWVNDLSFAKRYLDTAMPDLCIRSAMGS